MPLPKLMTFFFTNTMDIMLDYLLSAPKGFIAQETSYQIRNALLTIVNYSVNHYSELNVAKLMPVVFDVIEV